MSRRQFFTTVFGWVLVLLGWRKAREPKMRFKAEFAMAMDPAYRDRAVCIFYKRPA